MNLAFFFGLRCHPDRQVCDKVGWDVAAGLLFTWLPERPGTWALDLPNTMAGSLLEFKLVIVNQETGNSILVYI